MSKLTDSIRNMLVEQTEPLDELSKKTLGSYIPKAHVDGMDHEADAKLHGTPVNGSHAPRDNEKMKHHLRKSVNRQTGIEKAAKKLSEDVEKLEEGKKPWSGFPSGAASVASGTHSHFVEKHGRAPSDAELAKELKSRANDDQEETGWHRKHAKIAHELLSKKLNEEAESLDELSKQTLRKYIKKVEKNTKDHPGTEPAKRINGYLTALDKIERKKLGEEVESLDEISKETLNSYIDKAGPDAREKFSKSVVVRGRADRANSAWKWKELKTKADALEKKGDNRISGMKKALDKIVKEEADLIEAYESLDELSKQTLSRYLHHNQMDSNLAGYEMNSTKDSVRNHGAKTFLKRQRGLKKAVAQLTKEEFDALIESFEQLDELSKKTLKNYVAKADKDTDRLDTAYTDHRIGGMVASGKVADFHNDMADQAKKKYRSRHKGITQASLKMAKEDVDLIESYEQLDELSKKTLKSYIKKNVLGDEGLRNKIKDAENLTTDTYRKYGRMVTRPQDTLDKVRDLDKHTNKLRKKWDNRFVGHIRATRKLGEEVEPIIESYEQLDELSKKTLKSYIDQASGRAIEHDNSMRRDFTSAREADSNKERDRLYKRGDNFWRKKNNRLQGIRKATARLAKEELDLTEAVDFSQIKKDHEVLSKMSTSDLRDRYKRHHRVSDDNEIKRMAKDHLVSDILRAQHGNRKVDHYFKNWA